MLDSAHICSIISREKEKCGYLKNVRVRISSYGEHPYVHILKNVDSLIPLFGVELGLSLLNGFKSSGLDVYTRCLRRGLKIEIFEI